MLTDDQIVSLLSRDGSREDMLREAWRMGMRRAADVCRKSQESDSRKCSRRDAAIYCADAIRAEANYSEIPKSSGGCGIS